MYFADLHVHTDVSDGSETAETILREAKEKGITHIAFTDHDTTKSASKHKELSASFGIQAVTGVELSAYDFEGKKKVHILGYGYTRGKHIEALGRETLAHRQENCLRQIGILERLGYQMDVEKIQALAGGSIYKQHIFDYLVQTGQSEEMFGAVYQEIFKNGGACDFDIIYPAAEEAVRAVKADGGAAVLAHPGQQGNFDIIGRLAEAGLDGIEWNHPSHTEEHRRQEEEAAKCYRLFLTGGSDFHGRYERSSAPLGAYPAHISSAGQLYGDLAPAIHGQ